MDAACAAQNLGPIGGGGSGTACMGTLPGAEEVLRGNQNFSPLEREGT